ncbi:MAG: RNA polymerase sigma factor [Bacteroidota bacterium]
MDEQPGTYYLAEDKKIIHQVLCGNEFVLKRIYKEHYPKIQHMVLQNSGDEEDAKDLYQEAFVVFYQKISEEGFELTCSIGTFIYSISKNLWLKQLRVFSRNVVLRLDNEEEIWDAEEVIKEYEYQEKDIRSLESALKKLGEPCKTILVDFFFHKKSMEEIAEKMGYTNSANAKNQKYKCFNRLKKIFIVNNRTEEL